MKNKPKVTIGISTYNRKDYIVETLNSVFAQTFTDYEVIVVDDGSTDGTEEVIKNFGKPIRYYWKENGGDASARNKIIDLAEGEYITFIDSDDLLFSYSVKHLYEKIMANGGNCISYGNYVRIDEVGAEIGHTSKKLYSGNITKKLFKNIFVNSCGSMFPIEALKETARFAENLIVCSDYKKWLELSLKYSFFPLEGFAFKRRRHATNLSENSYEKSKIELNLLEEFYAQVGNDIISASIAKNRISKLYCKVAKIAKKENLTKDANKYFIKSLQYKFSLKTLFYFCYNKLKN